MALAAFTATLKQALSNSPTNYVVRGGGIADPSSPAAPSTAAVAAAVATLVADGATPTQAHVTTLNTAWGTFLTAETAYRAAAGSATSADTTLIVNTAVVSTVNQLKSVLKSLLQSALASGNFTP